HRAVGGDRDALFRDLRQPHRAARRRHGWLRLQAVHRPRTDHDVGDHQLLRQRGRIVLRGQVRQARGGDAGLPAPQLGDRRRLCRRRGGAGTAGRRRGDRGVAPLHSPLGAAPAGHRRGGTPDLAHLRADAGRRGRAVRDRGRAHEPRCGNQGVKTAVALVSARAARGLDEDMPPLLAAFAAAGAHAEIADWDDPEADWARFDAALLRSAWDYTERLPEFLDWIARVDAITTLLNPAPVLRWSADKHYLRDLERLGVPVVATTFVEPGADARETLGEFLERDACAELVVKPAVGAGSRDTRRHARAASAETLAHVRELLDAHRAVLLQ